MSNLPFVTENTRFEETPTIGGFGAAGKANSFDAVFEETHEKLLGTVNTMTDIGALIKNPDVMDLYKESVLEQLSEDCKTYAANFGPDCKTAGLYEEVSALWDNCVDDLMKESTSVAGLLPIKTVDLPLLVKQHISVAAKDIIQTEITPTPIIKKHIEQTYVTATVEKSAGVFEQKMWRYPQCFFNGDYKEIYNAGKGLEIPGTAVALPLMNWDLITNLVPNAQAGKDKFTMDLHVVAVDMAVDKTANPIVYKKIILKTPMRINLADGSWLGGQISVGDGAGTDKATYDEMIVGYADMFKQTISLNCCNQTIKSVYFEGFLSNERNERQTSLTYKREELEWKIEDGARTGVPYSLEELEDAKALLNIDLYKKSYDNLADLLANMEDSKILDYLDTEYNKYKGLELDPLGFNSFVREKEFNAKNESAYGVLQSEYIEKMLKWHIDRFTQDLVDSAKVQDMTFVLYGNPRYISLLGDTVKWVVQSGDMVGGIKTNYSYGIMTSGNYKIQVVSTNKMNVGDTLQRGIRIIPYPIDKEMMTFKHYKYTSHILTSANSGYRDPNLPGGSKTYLMGVSRYTNAAVQGLQGHLAFTNDEFINKK